MRLAVPANYDIEILPELRRNDVTEIYGKLPTDIVGGGRPSYMSSPLGKRQLARYVVAARKQGIGFNYLLNAACFGNREWTAPFHRGLGRLLDWLTEIGVETVTISAPYLLQIVKRRYPHFRTKVGIYAQVDTVQRARYWEDLGADGINLESFSINRSFETLARIRAAVRCDLQLIANTFCLPNCAMQIQHQNGHSHASSTAGSFLIDYPLIQCHQRRLADPSLLIAGGWIRPEDIGHYEAMGYGTFKLTERNMPSADLLQRVRAYSSRRFEGNLAEILFSWGFSERAPHFSWLHFLRHFASRHLPLRDALFLRDFMKLQGFFFPRRESPVVIDSRAIPANFIDHFRRGDCRDRECGSCGYCAAVAEKAVHIDPEFREKSLAMGRDLEDRLVGGSLFGVSERAAA